MELKIMRYITFITILALTILICGCPQQKAEEPQNKTAPLIPQSPDDINNIQPTEFVLIPEQKPEHPKDTTQNISEPDTNQRAELIAIINALELCQKDLKTIIHTDSKYAIKSSTEWYKKWR